MSELELSLKKEAGYCIYCLCKLEGSGDLNTAASREHVIPEALGGRYPLVTRDCCKQCNSTLGHSIDGPLVSDFLVFTGRSKYDLSGKTGRAPSMSLPFSDMEIEGHSVFYGDRIEHRLVPKVQVDKKPDDKQVLSISGSPEKVRQILAGKLRKYPEQLGIEACSEAEIPKIVDQMTSKAEIKSLEKIQVTVSCDLLAVYRGLAKIALGVGHFFLGAEWTFHDGSQSVREIFQSNKGGQEVPDPLPWVPPDMQNSFFGPTAWPEDAHFVAFLPFGSEILIFVSLFGEEALSMVFSSGVHKRLPWEQSLGAAVALPINGSSVIHTQGIDFLHLKKTIPAEALKLMKDLGSR